MTAFGRILPLVALAATLPVWAQVEPAPATPKVRSVRIQFVATNGDEAASPVSVREALDRLSRADAVQVEHPLRADDLEQARAVLTEVYAEHGIPVRVLDRTRSMQPQAMEVEFIVVERCACQ